MGELKRDSLLLVTLGLAFITVFSAGSMWAAEPIVILVDPGAGQPGQFAAEEIRLAGNALRLERPMRITLSVDSRSEHGSRLQSYMIRANHGTGEIDVIGIDAVGAMYGGLDVAEALRAGRIAELRNSKHVPNILQRGIKMNVPLDLRTPSYSDMSDASQANIPVVWDLGFWQEVFDDMARNRFNVISLWSLHPFPSLVKVPEYPHVALDDVWRTKVKLDENFSGNGEDFVRKEMLDDHEVVKTISIEDKIVFWRTVMQMAKDRGIDVLWFTWNIFTHGAEGKDGLIGDRRSREWIGYLRASVREMIRTYPLLAGFGITAGEGFPEGMESVAKEKWLWDTYGEGIRDGLRDTPDRKFRLIHRCHMTGIEVMRQAFRELPCQFDLSFKYAIAHMYSVPKPSMINPLLPHLSPELRSWLTIRNDDIYSFRWADVDYARAFIRGIPPEDKIAGFYMGCDGYFWGRDFLSKDPGSPRPTIMRKQWHSFALWGRLAYNPGLSAEVFESLTAVRFPKVEVKKLIQAWAHASRTFPSITRFFWGDIDVRWFPEACRKKQGFYTLRDFVVGESMPGAKVMNIIDWRRGFLAKRKAEETTPIEIADTLEENATQALHFLDGLRGAISGTDMVAKEYQATLGDIESMAHLGHYYAAKIRGACDIALFDKTGEEDWRESSIRHLDDALVHWIAYAKSYASQNVQPVLYNRTGVVDIPGQTGAVRNDIAMARSWKKGDITEASLQRLGTETGFSK